jgi:glucose-1-phosphate adenylyltransferase
VVVLAGDHVYKMNYALMLADHVASGRDMHVGCIEVPRSEATAFGVMAVDEHSRITDFVEKPANPPPPCRASPTVALASMGIYIFDADFLYAELERDMADPNSSHDFGKDIIPRAGARGQRGGAPVRA